MKIFFTLLITCVFGLNSLIAQKKSETDKERGKLRGTVKKIENYLIDFSVQGDLVIEKERPWFTNSYNSDGSYSEHISYLSDGNISTDVYLYNQGENIECRTYSNSTDKALNRFQKYTHKFDDQGNIVESIVTESDGSLTARFVYKFDAKGNEIEYRNYYHTGALGGKVISTYGEDGTLLSKIYSDSNDSLIWKHLYIVNNKGQTIEDSTYIGETLRYKILFTYDDKKRVLQQETLEFNAIPNQHTSHAPEPGKIVFIYDDKRKTKEEIRFNKNGFAEKTLLTVYDEKDNEIENVWYESSGSFDELMQSKDKSPAAQRKSSRIFKGKMTYQYEYDAQGNWTKKTHRYQAQANEQPNLQSAERRIISYY